MWAYLNGVQTKICNPVCLDNCDIKVTEGHEYAATRKSGDNNYNKGWNLITAKLQIGDKYWNGSTWTTTDTTFSIPFHDANVATEKETLSYYRKPDATTAISRENWKELVWPLPVGDLLYVGGAARKLLKQYGITTISQLAACKPEMLETLMGKMGLQLHDYANGLDHDPVRSRYDAEPVKSVGNGTTFPQNLTTREQVHAGIAVLADSVASRLRHAGLYAGGVQVTVRDPQFHDRSRQRQLAAPTHLIRDLTDAAMELVYELWKPPTPIRALTVTAIHLVQEGEAYEQVDLFGSGPGKEKQEKLESAMDRIRKKFGADAIVFGAARPEKEEDPLP